MTLELRLTRRCNLRCTYCYCTGEAREGDMSRECLDAAVALAVERSRRSGDQRLDITFFGGEPLLCPDLIRHALVRWGKAGLPDLRIAFHLCTNGLLLDQAMLELLGEYGVGLVLSLDGPAAVHDACRLDAAGRGSFTSLLPRLEALVSRRPLISMVISPAGASRLGETLAWCFDRGLTRVIALPDFGAPWTRSSLDALGQGYRDACALLGAWRGRGQAVTFSPIDDKIRLALDGSSYADHSCRLDGRTMVVDSDGRIYPCTRLACGQPDLRWSLGTVGQPTRGNPAPAMRQAMAKGREQCRDCAIRSRCLGAQCACLAFSWQRDLGAVQPLVCEHERMLAAIADEYASTCLHVPDQDSSSSLESSESTICSGKESSHALALSSPQAGG